MLPAIVLILFFTGALIAAQTVIAALALNEHSKQDFSGIVLGVLALVAVGGVISGWQTLEVLNRGFSPLNF